MPRDPLPTFCLILELRGQFVGALSRADFPTETLMTLEFSIAADRAIFDWMSQALMGRRQALPGNLVVLDTSLSEIHRDAWDWGWIQQIAFPAMEAASGGVPHFSLALQIANLREVAAKPISGRGSGHKRGISGFYSFKVEMNGARANYGVRKLSSLIVNLGPNVAGMLQKTGAGLSSEVAMTMAESNAADFRAWKQSGGPRDVTIQCLSTALAVICTYLYKGATIDRIHPAAPVSTTGDTQVTLKVAGVTFSL